MAPIETDEQLQIRTCDHNSRREPLSREESRHRRRAFAAARAWFEEHGDQYTAADYAEAVDACRVAIAATILGIIAEAILSELVQIWIEHWMHQRGW